MCYLQKKISIIFTNIPIFSAVYSHIKSVIFHSTWEKILKREFIDILNKTSKTKCHLLVYIYKRGQKQGMLAKFFRGLSFPKKLIRQKSYRPASERGPVMKLSGSERDRDIRISMREKKKYPLTLGVLRGTKNIFNPLPKLAGLNPMRVGMCTFV